jgi:hypothetical protein
VNPLPQSGAVVGVDVGYSTVRRSSAVCRLWWNDVGVGWDVARFRHDDDDRERAFRQVVGSEPVMVAAFDGPLKRGLGPIGHYRKAEKDLTVREIRTQIGKPGQSSSANGRDLNRAANACARSMIKVCSLEPARHVQAIHSLAIVEAFPTSFLGLLIDSPLTLAVRPPARSDAYYVYLADSGGLDRLLQHLLLGRTLHQAWRDFRNHDDRAAIVCALTALCVAARDYVAVGDHEDGWIMLPPPDCLAVWAKDLLAQPAATTVN